MLRRAFAAFLQEQASSYDELLWLRLAGQTAGSIWDDESWYLLSESLARSARQTGALSLLPFALSDLGGSLVRSGELEQGRALTAEMRDVSEMLRTGITPYVTLACAAYKGDRAELNALTAATAADATRRGEGAGLTFIHYATAILHNGLGEYPQALAAARQATDDLHGERFRNWALAELSPGPDAPARAVRA